MSRTGDRFRAPIVVARRVVPKAPGAPGVGPVEGAWSRLPGKREWRERVTVAPIPAAPPGRVRVHGRGATVRAPEGGPRARAATPGPDLARSPLPALKFDPGSRTSAPRTRRTRGSTSPTRTPTTLPGGFRTRPSPSRSGGRCATSSPNESPSPRGESWTRSAGSWRRTVGGSEGWAPANPNMGPWSPRVVCARCQTAATFYGTNPPNLCPTCPCAQSSLVPEPGDWVHCQQCHHVLPRV